MKKRVKPKLSTVGGHSSLYNANACGDFPLYKLDSSVGNFSFPANKVNGDSYNYMPVVVNTAVPVFGAIYRWIACQAVTQDCRQQGMNRFLLMVMLCALNGFNFDALKAV